MRKNIHRVKWLFIGAAAGLTALLFLWPSGKDNMVQLSAKRAEPKELEDKFKGKQERLQKTTMLSPRFSGENAAGEQWHVQAESASARLDKTLLLDKVSATVMAGTAREIAVSAGHGAYIPEREEIHLAKGVHAFGQGAELHQPI